MDYKIVYFKDIEKDPYLSYMELINEKNSNLYSIIYDYIDLLNEKGIRDDVLEFFSKEAEHMSDAINICLVFCTFISCYEADTSYYYLLLDLFKKLTEDDFNAYSQIISVCIEKGIPADKILMLINESDNKQVFIKKVEIYDSLSTKEITDSANNNVELYKTNICESQSNVYINLIKQISNIEIDGEDLSMENVQEELQKLQQSIITAISFKQNDKSIIKRQAAIINNQQDIIVNLQNELFKLQREFESMNNTHRR